MAPQGKRWCFTSFDESPPFLSLPDGSTYLVYQREKCPKTDKEHWQGFITFVGQKRLNTVKSLAGGNNWHWEVARGKNTECRAYCTKEDTRVAPPVEFGQFTELGSNKRKTMELFQEDPEELKIADPQKYRRCLAIITNQRFVDVALPTFDRQWQLEVGELLEQPADDRTIIWVYGSKGNEGKTTYVKGLIQKGWFNSRGGKSDDIMFQYIVHGGHAVFDFPRDKEDYVNYNVLEAIKDRTCISNKYEPLSINFPSLVHVLVMANFMPQLEDEFDEKGRIVKKQMLSVDRIKLIEC